jgi:hypothetical protein
VSIVLHELAATYEVMRRASQDDLIVLLADHPEEVWNAVVSRTQSRQDELATRSD